MSFLILAVPVMAAVGWTRYTDAQKELNPLGQHLTSTALRVWNFGTLDQRLSAGVWGTIFDRFGLILGNIVVGAAAVIALWLARRRWLEAAACFALVLAGPLFFINLYYVHEYYAFATGVFLIAAVGISLTALVETGRRHIAYGVFIAFLVASLVRYSQHYYPKQAADHKAALPVCTAVQQMTAPDDVLVVGGCDWSPVIPFYSERRALMIPNWPQVSLEDIPFYLRGLNGHRIGALVIGRTEESRFDPQLVHSLIRLLEFDPSCRYTDEAYEVYAPPLSNKRR
jgi:hypothetical protein